MLSIRNAEPTDFNSLKTFMKAEGQLVHSNDLDLFQFETMLLMDEAQILGYAMAELRKGQPFISMVYIPEKLRGHLLGDATLRGLLFYFMNRGFEKTYAASVSPFASFLVHEGFTETDNGLEIVMDDFFNQKCRGCRDQH